MSTGQGYSECYPAVAESVPAARAALSSFAAQAGAGGSRLDSIRLAASEAITNAVMHAYATEPARASAGAIHISASAVEDELWILIADEGGGIRARADSKGLGLGLVLIAQLTDDFQILNRGGGGTELRLRFKLTPGEGEDGGQPRGSLSVATSPA